jgi:hypothetical protein
MFLFPRLCSSTAAAQTGLSGAWGLICLTPWAAPHLSKGVSSGPGGVTAPAADARTNVAMRAGRCTLLTASSCCCGAGLPTRLAAAGRTACAAGCHALLIQQVSTKWRQLKGSDCETAWLQKRTHDTEVKMEVLIDRQIASV